MHMYIYLFVHAYSQTCGVLGMVFPAGIKNRTARQLQADGEISGQALQTRDLYIWDIYLIVLKVRAVSKAIEGHKHFQSIVVQNFTTD